MKKGKSKSSKSKKSNARNAIILVVVVLIALFIVFTVFKSDKRSDGSEGLFGGLFNLAPSSAEVVDVEYAENVIDKCVKCFAACINSHTNVPSNEFSGCLRDCGEKFECSEAVDVCGKAKDACYIGCDGDQKCRQGCWSTHTACLKKERIELEEFVEGISELTYIMDSDGGDNPKVAGCRNTYNNVLCTDVGEGMEIIDYDEDRCRDFGGTGDILYEVLGSSVCISSSDGYYDGEGSTKEYSCNEVCGGSGVCRNKQDACYTNIGGINVFRFSAYCDCS